MSRNRRVVVFLTDDEWNKIRACGPADDGMSKVIRRLALRSAGWMLRVPRKDGSARQEEGIPLAWEPELAVDPRSVVEGASSVESVGDGPVLDRSESQI
jgi:hypothetical protein